MSGVGAALPPVVKDRLKLLRYKIEMLGFPLIADRSNWWQYQDVIVHANEAIVMQPISRDPF